MRLDHVKAICFLALLVPNQIGAQSDLGRIDHVKCAANRKLSDSIPVTRINPTIELLGSGGSWRTHGSRMAVVVVDSAMWPAAWRAAFDSVATPKLAFGPDAIILAATGSYSMGPLGFRITGIRQCRQSGVVVVTTMETRSLIPVGLPMRARSFDLVRIPRARLLDHPVLFNQQMRFKNPVED